MNGAANNGAANANDDVLEKGFQLAYFIVPDRPIAIQILGDAASKLAAQRTREQKRAYWRDKHLKRKVTRTIRQDADLLQWLIYFAAEKHEAQQEQNGQVTTEDMVIRYIKHLVQITTSMSSFYVNVGLQRLLHNYSTSETSGLYEWVTDLFPGGEEYRRVKGALMSRLQARFGGLLSTCPTERGELRFKPYSNQKELAELVGQCLSRFTPWSTTQACWVPVVSTASLWSPTQFLEAKLGKNNCDLIEAHRSHAFIHPSCFEGLIRQLAFFSPSQRLNIPQFFLSTNGEDQGESGSRGAPPSLTNQERQDITTRLETERKRRGQIVPATLRIVVDGVERVRLHLFQQNRSQCELPLDAKLIEIWSEDHEGDILLATHWIDHTDAHIPAAIKARVDFGAVQLVLKITPGSTSTLLVLERQAASPWIFWKTFFRLPRLQQRYALVTGLAVLLSLGVTAASYRVALIKQRATVIAINEELSREKAAHLALQQSMLNSDVESIHAYRLIDDNLRTRESQETPETVVTISPRIALISLELPVGSRAQNRYRARLQSLRRHETIMEQNYLKTASTQGQFFVTVLLPSSLLQADEYYVITLDEIREGGQLLDSRSFTFRAENKQSGLR
jgi:hypothetical protein